ncbi:unnamed protein product [Arabidopsis lyrata]|nr:unnamed protein product [Arabidopsis lyrata]
MTNHEYVPSMVLIKLSMLLLLLVLTPHADSGSIVKFLPGFEGPLPFELETGYIGVGEEEERWTWLLFCRCLLFENGPVTFKVDGYNGGSPTLLSTTYSWTKVANIIFLDQPVGTGFSYAKTQLLETPSDSGEAKRIHEFMRKWLSKHTEFISNPFYVGGDSYSGKVIPATVQEISKGIDLGFKPPINLEGYVIGNPVTDTEIEHNLRIPFAHEMSLISDELYESLKRSCKGIYFYVDPLNTECLKYVEEYNKCTAKININLVTRPLCKVLSSPRRYIEELVLAIPSVPSTDCYSCTDLIASNWANDENVREALHVVKGSIRKWVRCASYAMPYNMDIKSSVPYHMNNSIRGYRSLIYNGDHDMVVPFIGTKAWIRSLNYSIIDNWKPWMINKQVGGYAQTYANKMTLATVKGGGHTAEYTPVESSILFQRWLTGQLL